MSVPMELITGLLGSFIGGGFTLLGSYYSTKRQFEEQRAIEREKEYKTKLTAFKALHIEIAYNILSLRRVKEYTDENSSWFSEDNRDNIFHNLSTEKWDKYSDLIEMTIDEEKLLIIRTFYFNMMTHKKLEKGRIEGIDLILDMALEAGNVLKMEYEYFLQDRFEFQSKYQ